MAKRSARTGCIVVDNSSFWRYHADVPLVVPEVNAQVLDAYMARNDRKNIIANPNCSTAQMVVALKPLHDFATIKRVVVATYQSVSGAGKEGRRRALDADQGHLRQRQADAQEVPQADRLQRHSAHRRLHGRRLDQGRVEDGGRDQEDPRSQDQAHAPPACACRCSSAIPRRSTSSSKSRSRADEARDILREAPGVSVIDKREPGGYATPIEAVGEYDTYVSPHPRGCDGRERPRRSGWCRTTCARARRSTPCRSSRR